MSKDEEPAVSEGDKVVFTSGERTETTVSEVFEDGSFFLEWRDSRGRHAQIFTPGLFTRDGRHVEHVPAPRSEQSTLVTLVDGGNDCTVSPVIDHDEEGQ